MARLPPDQGRKCCRRIEAGGRLDPSAMVKVMMPGDGAFQTAETDPPGGVRAAGGRVGAVLMSHWPVAVLWLAVLGLQSWGFQSWRVA